MSGLTEPAALGSLSCMPVAKEQSGTAVHLWIAGEVPFAVSTPCDGTDWTSPRRQAFVRHRQR